MLGFAVLLIAVLLMVPGVAYADSGASSKTIMSETFVNPLYEGVIDELRQYLQKVYVVNPAADFNQHPVTAIKGIPFDLQALVVRGR